MDQVNELIASMRSGVGLIIAAYVLMSSSMLVINKLAVTYLPAPSVVLYAQLAVSAIAAVLLHRAGMVETDALEWGKVKKFWVVAFVFLGTIFTNIKCLQYANVETFIVFRSSTPMLIAVLDYFFLGRELPDKRSLLSLVAITLGAIGYIATDNAFRVEAYLWVVAWFVMFATDVVYIKYIIDTVPMTAWGRVFYQNLIALAPLTVIGLCNGDVANMLGGSLEDPASHAAFHFSTASYAALAASCVGGIGMCYSGFLLRKEVSATSFTVIGILCKVGTLVVNRVIWDKHAGLEGTAFLMVCMFAGMFYKQAPLREGAAPADAVTRKESKDSEEVELKMKLIK